MSRELPCARLAGRIASVVLAFVVGVRPAAAQPEYGCSLSESSTGLQPLIDLLNSFVELAFIAGILVGTVGFLTAGILIAAPFGEDWTRRGKQLGKNVFFGVVILFSAQMIVEFLASQLGATVC